MTSQQVHITLPHELIKKIDVAAKEASFNRSEFMRRAAAELLKIYEEYNAKLANIAQGDTPSEYELFDLLKLKRRQRAAAQWRREWRRDSIPKHGL